VHAIRSQPLIQGGMLTAQFTDERRHPMSVVIIMRLVCSCMASWRRGQSTPDFRLPPRCKRDMHSSGILPTVGR